MAKARIKPEDLLGARPEVALLPQEPASPFLDPAVAQAEPEGSELYNLGTVQQAAASQSPENEMFMPSAIQPSRAYPTGTEGGVARPEGASPLLYPTAQETQPRLTTRLKPEEALALAEVNRPRRKSPDQIIDEMATGMYDANRDPLPMDLWEKASERRSQMIKDGRLPMEFGEIDSLMGGLVWGKDAAYGMMSYIANTTSGVASSLMSQPVESVRQSSATIPSAIQRLSTELGLQTYQDLFNLTHEPMYRVKETGEFVAVNKTGLPLMLPAASGGNRVISGDGMIDPVTPEQGIREFAKRGMTLVPLTDQDRKEYRYGQYLDRMAIMSESAKAQNLKAPPEFVSAALTGRWDTVEPNQAQAEFALLAAQSVIPAGAATRTWGVGRRVAGGLSRAAEAVETVAGFPVDVDTALRAKFVNAVTRGTGADAVAQKTAMQAAIDASKTTAKVGGAYAVAAGVSAFEGTPSELKDLAWTAANLYSGYKGGMYVARQLRAASGFTKTVLKEVADPAQGLDAGARAAVAANPAVPQAVREVLENPSRYQAMESTPARLAQNQELSPTSRAIFNKLSDYRFVQAARLARDTAAGVPKGMIVNVPFAAGAMASDDPERAGQILAAGGVFGAFGGAASRLTEAKQRRAEEATSDIARMLVDIQAGNELGSGLGGEILRNRMRPGARFQDGERGFVMPEQEVASFLTEMEMAGADVAAFVQGKSFDELAQWAAYQGFFRDKVDLIPLNAADYKLNAEANGQNGSGAYFLQPSEGRRARIFVNAESRRNGLAPHEYGHAVLRGGALSPDQIDAVHADINSRYTPDALKAMANEYAASMVRAENAKAGMNIEPSPAAIEAKVSELSQGSMVKGSADGLDWLREEIFAEEFRNANIDLSRARRNVPLGVNPVSFMENLLGAQSRALHMAGIDIDPQTGKPMGRDQIFKENRVAAGDPVVMKNYEAYVKQWRQWIKDPTHEVDPGVAVSKTGNVQDTANNPNVTWRTYERTTADGRKVVTVENEFGIKNPDGTVTPKDWNEDIKPTVRARQQAVREMSNRSKQVASADDPTFGMRTQRDGRRVISGRYLPDSFFYIPQYKPFHSDIRKIVAADNAGETLQVRYYAKGKSKDIFKDGIKNVNAVNREAMHGNFVAKKDGTLMWGYLDMTQFRNRAMKAIADRNPALEPYNWDFKALMDDLPTHLRDQASGRGGAVTVGQERANVLNGLIGIGTGPLVGAFGKGTAYKTIHLDSIDAVVPTGKQGGQFDVYRANRNAMPDDPKPPVDMTTDLTPDNNNRMPQALPRAAMGMPDVVQQADIPLNPRARQAAFIGVDGNVRATGRRTHFETNEDLGPDFLAIGAGHVGEDGFFRFGSQTMDDAMGDSPATSAAAAARFNQSLYDQGRRPSAMLEEPPGLERASGRGQTGQAMPDVDADYMAAVERGNMKAAQRMVDDAAERSGFNIKAFHGTPEGGFTQFRETGGGLFFSSRESIAQGYTYFRNPWLSPSERGQVYRAQLRMENPLKFDAGGARHNNIPFPGREYKRTVFGNIPEDAVSVEDAAKLAFAAGHDGVIIENVMDGVSMDNKTRSTVYAIKSPDQAKITDPITRDSAGNIIPPSKRFATGRTRGQAMPDVDVRQGAAETLDQLKRSQFIPTKVAAEVVGGFPEYLRPVAQFITDQRQKLANGQMTRRDVMKAYAMTVASQGSGARAVEVIANNVAKDGIRFRPSKDFTTVNKQGRAAIRPEEAAAYWLGTEAGQRALNNFEAGRFNPDDWKELVAIRKAYGDDRFNNLGAFNPENIVTMDKVLADLNASRADTGKVMDAVQQLRGIKTGKKGFIAHLLGIGDVPTIDAVEINFWLTGKADIGKLNTRRATLARNIKNSISDKRVSQEMFRRIDQRINALRDEVPGGAEIAPEVWSHVMHHWLWDKSKGIETTHEGMYRAQAQFMPDAAPILENFDSANEVTGGRLRPVLDQPENAPVVGRITPAQEESIRELDEYYRKVTPQRIKELRKDAIDSLANRLINKGIPVAEARGLATETYKKIKSRVAGASQVISGMGASDLSRMAGTGRPAVPTRKGVNPNWLTSAFEAFESDNDLALMKAQQVAKQLNKKQQAEVSAGKSVDAARASKVRVSTVDLGMQFLIGEGTADKKAFGSSLREDPAAPPRVYASVVEGQKFGSQGNYALFFEWKKSTPIVATSHHHYGVGNGLTDIHASANIGDKNARSFGNPETETYDTLPSGKKVLNTRLLVGNAGIDDIRTHQLLVSIPETALSGVRAMYKKGGFSSVKSQLNDIAVRSLVGTKSQGKTKALTSKDGIPVMVAVQKNRTEAYVLNPDLRNVESITIVENKNKEKDTALIKKNLASAFKNNGSPLPRIKVVSAESGPSGNPGRKKITDEFFNLTGKVVYGAALGGAAALTADESEQ